MTGDHDAGRRIVVGLDASPASEAALRWAIGYARSVGAEVVAVHAFEPPVHYSYPYDSSSAVLDETLREGVQRAFVEDWCALLAASGVRYRATLIDGRAADVLLEVAEREGAELVVTGRRGLNTLGELVLGSVSHRLVHSARRPVVLVPGGEQVAA